MLPEKYASDIISLNKNGDRKHALTVKFRLKDAAAATEPEFVCIQPSTVKVLYSLSYDEAQQLMDFQEKVERKLLMNIIRLGKVTGERDTHKMIEKIMIWTNQAVGKFLFNHGSNLSVYCPAPPVSQSSIPEDLRRFGPRAVYSVEEHGHGMMGLEYYTHFTSPIRRYADLVVHRLVKNILNGVTNDMDQTKEILTVINDVTGKSKHYYRECGILKIVQELKEQPPRDTVGYILDYCGQNYVFLYIKDLNLMLRTRLFADELKDIWTVTMEDGQLIIHDKARLPMFTAVPITVTCFPHEIRINKKIRVSFFDLNSCF
jgi:exoribonuclease R